MATLLKVLNNLADIKSAGGVALRVTTQGRRSADDKAAGDADRRDVVILQQSKVRFTTCGLTPGRRSSMSRRGLKMYRRSATPETFRLGVRTVYCCHGPRAKARARLRIQSGGPWRPPDSDSERQSVGA
jgi:hypothetical protein